MQTLPVPVSAADFCRLAPKGPPEIQTTPKPPWREGSLEAVGLSQEGEG